MEDLTEPQREAFEANVTKLALAADMSHSEARSTIIAVVDALAEGPGEGLTALERDMLDLEAQRFKYAGIKRDKATKLMARHGHEGASLDIRYHQVLNRLLDRPEAAEYAPALVARLKTKRAA